ncbi:hypothetical protein [Ferruginibacter sp. SUN106]|uniref:hypothetical protein n=1 Tax=Ferruginibacter sp. SUN106 TaxID=2978348 RepID=UPI003D35DD76
MGLSIHYSGTIKDYALIDELVIEVEDICKTFNWQYNVFTKKNSGNDTRHIQNPAFISYKMEDVKGISFSPENCEPVALTFFPSGKLCSFEKLLYNNPETNDLMVEVVSTKTQYAGVDAHMALLNLLQYLKDKYFADFKLSDEGNYWETKDKKILEENFSRYNFLMDTVADALSNFKTVPGEPVQSLADRLEEFLKNKLGHDKKE